MRIGDTLTVETVRGRLSWDYLYTTLGFAFTIESTVIGMMTPISCPWNIILFATIAAFTIWLFIESEWLHDKLLAIKTKYENKAR